MRENKVKNKIKEGKLVLGSYCNPLRLFQIELMAEVGYDYVVLDTESGPYYGVEHCVNGIRTAEMAGITPFIRVSHNNPVLIRKAIGIGAYGVWVPHVDSEEECRLAVQAARGKSANEETMVTVLPLESKEGIDNIEEILSVKGLDMVSLSVGDITYALGYPGQPLHPEVVKVRDRVWELCKMKGVAAYALGNMEMLKYYHGKGVHVFQSGINLRKAFQEHMNELNRILS